LSSWLWTSETAEGQGLGGDYAFRMFALAPLIAYKVNDYSVILVRDILDNSVTDISDYTEMPKMPTTSDVVASQCTEDLITYGKYEQISYQISTLEEVNSIMGCKGELDRATGATYYGMVAYKWKGNNYQPQIEVWFENNRVQYMNIICNLYIVDGVNYCSSELY
jgi:hypothetical protein